MMRAARHAHGREAEVLTKMEGLRASAKREDTLRALAAHVVSKEHPVKEERPMWAKSTVAVSQSTLSESMASIPGLIGDVVTALIRTEGQYRVKRTDNRLQAVLQILVNMTLDEKLKYVKFVDRMNRKVE